jgi:hypothetical protein
MEKVKENEITFEKLGEVYSRSTIEIKNEALYNKINRLIGNHFPNVRGGWMFYFPCKDEKGKEYLIPFFVGKTRHGSIFVEIRNGGSFEVRKEEGEKRKEEEKEEDFLFSLIDKAIEIQSSLTQEEIEKKVIFRYAKIKRKELYPPELSEEEANKLLKDYEESQKTKKPKNKISLFFFYLRQVFMQKKLNLEIYLNVFSILAKELTKKKLERIERKMNETSNIDYKTFLKGWYEDLSKEYKTLEDLKPEEVYKRCADFRRVFPFDRLEGVNPKKISNRQLLRSIDEDRKRGTHTFELEMYGIELLPSNKEFFIFPLNVEGLYMEYLDAIRVLIEKKIPFSTDETLLKEAIAIATGEKVVWVHDFEIPESKLSKVIEWEELPAPREIFSLLIDKKTPKLKLEIRK